MQKNRTPIMIGIAGGSCSGKTLLANAIARSYPPGEAVAIGLDSYYLDRSSCNTDASYYDRPEALEKDAVFSQLKMLLRGETIQKPVYDYTNHRRCSSKEIVRPARRLVIEGLYALYWEEIRRLLQVKIFIDADHAVCLRRRLERDTKERGRTPASVRRQYNESVRPMYERHIRGTRRYANIVIDGNDAMDRMVARTLTGIERLIRRL